MGGIGCEEAINYYKFILRKRVSGLINYSIVFCPKSLGILKYLLKKNQLAFGRVSIHHLIFCRPSTIPTLTLKVK